MYQQSCELTASLLGLMLDLIVFLAPLQKLLLAARGLDVLDTHMNSLGHDPAIVLQHHGLVKIMAPTTGLLQSACLRPYPTCLLTTTPTARFVTFHTLPVRPWYTLWGIPCSKHQALSSTALMILKIRCCGAYSAVYDITVVHAAAHLLYS